MTTDDWKYEMWPRLDMKCLNLVNDPQCFIWLGSHILGGKYLIDWIP